MIKRFPVRVGCLGLLVATAVVLTSAQTAKPAPEQSRLVQAIIVNVQPGMVAEYVEYQKNDVMPALKTGGIRGRTAFSVGAFGDTGTFAFFAPVTSLADYDSPNPVQKALGEQSAAQLMAKGGKFLTSRRVLLMRTRPDLSVAGDPKAPMAPIELVTEIRVAPGRRGDFETTLKREIVPVMQQAKVKSYEVLEVVYGEEAGTFFSSIPFDSYEALGKGHPLQMVLGEEGSKRVEAKFTGIVTHLERFIARYREDLSIKPASPSTQQ
jgi:hypothetical protein